MLLIWDTPFIVIDLETTGSDPKKNNIIEIAYVLVQGGTILDEFSTLVNPKQHIPYFISKMTGITNEMAYSAPEMSEILPLIKKLLDKQNIVFVAHNANFDYEFLKSAFEKNRVPFPALPKLCTLRLARRLIGPEQKKNLGSLANYFHIDLNERHRAYADARATAQVLVKLLEVAESEHRITTTEEILSFQYKPYSTYSLSRSLNERLIPFINQAPDKPGVYYFLDKTNNYLYIGKAVSLKRRIESYLSSTTSLHILRLLRSTKKITWVETESELSSLILESREIKKYQPIFNVFSRKWRCFPFIQITEDNDYPIFEITYSPSFSSSFCVGPFKNREIAEVIIELINKKFKLRKCKKEDYNRQGCLYSQTKSCIAPCNNTSETKNLYFEELTKAKNFLLNLENGLIKQLELQMKCLSEQEEFELAIQIKKEISELKKTLSYPFTEFADINERNFIIVHPLPNQHKNEVIFIKDGSLVWDKLFENEIDVDLLNQKIYETYYNGKSNKVDFSPEYMDELRIISNWVALKRNEIKIIKVSPK
ncbi:MAG: exonuclease domain-containing protein [Ignavibacteria bacterium]|nr:exonuclease domain-containing protein [Ignavibacteria bacterium]